MSPSATTPTLASCERAPVHDLVLDPANVRTHDEKNLEAIKGSLARFGQQKPIVVGRGNVVIAGNGTLLAARALGWPDIAIVRTDLAGAEALAYAIADNRTSELAGWDTKALAEQLAALERDGAAPPGFDADDLRALAAALVAPPRADGGADDGDDGSAAPPREAAVSVLGDVWLLGEHRLVCGDAATPEAWRALLGGERAAMLWTDPPYGVAYVGGTEERLTLENDDLDSDALRGLLDAALGHALRASTPGAPWYVCSPAGPLSLVFGQALLDLGVLRQQLVWVKDRLVLGQSDFHYRHELIWYGWPRGGAHRPPPDRVRDTVWAFPKPTRNALHPTMKPVEMVEYALTLSSTPGDVVVDCFGGGGSTLIAAENLRRRARLIELDPVYVDRIVGRWQEHTGRVAHHESSGLEWSKVAAERKVGG